MIFTPKFLFRFFYPGQRSNKLIFSFFILVYSQSHAQLNQPARYEKVQKYSDGYFTIVSLKEEGLVLLRDKEKYNNGNRLWEFIVLDTSLQETKVIDVEVKDRNRIVGYEYTPSHVYLLFRAGESNKTDIELLEIKLTDFSIKSYTIKPELTYQVTHFSKIGSHVVFGGYVNNEPAVLLYNLQEDQIKVLPGFFQKDMELVDLRINVNNTFNTVLIDRSQRDEGRLIFQSFDESGKMLLEDIVIIDQNKTLQTGITGTLEREDLLVLGTWGYRNAKSSTGFYALPVNPFEDQKIQFISFPQLDHYLDYMKSKRAERIKARTEFEISEGRNPSYTSSVMPYRIAEHKDGFFLLAEVYHTSSNFNSYPYGANPYYYNPYYYNPYWPGYYPGLGRMYARPYSYGRNNTRNSEEIRTYESVVVAFDAAGNVKWDHSLKLDDDIKLPGIEQVSEFHYDDTEITFFYKDESDLKVRTVNLDNGEKKEESLKIQTKDPLDEIRSDRENEGGVRHWFGNSYYVWGYQTIRNNKAEDRVRDVFYVNKVVVK